MTITCASLYAELTAASLWAFVLGCVSCRELRRDLVKYCFRSVPYRVLWKWPCLNLCTCVLATSRASENTRKRTARGAGGAANSAFVGIDVIFAHFRRNENK